MINRQAAAYWIPAFAGMTIGRGCKSGPLRMRAQANVTSAVHRPRRRAIQYCRGADDHSRGRGVLDTRFRGYDGGAYDERDLFAHASAAMSVETVCRDATHHVVVPAQAGTQ